LLLKEEAHRYEAVADWTGAEATYRQGLALSEKQGNHGARFMAHYDISALFRIVGQDELAFQEDQLTTEAARCADSTVLLRDGFHLAE
jgi:hypothetical protein